MDKLRALRARLQKQQRDLILVAAESAGLPADGIIRKIADLESVITAIDAFIEEEGRRPSPKG